MKFYLRRGILKKIYIAVISLVVIGVVTALSIINSKEENLTKIKLAN